MGIGSAITFKRRRVRDFDRLAISLPRRSRLRTSSICSVITSSFGHHLPMGSAALPFPSKRSTHGCGASTFDSVRCIRALDMAHWRYATEKRNREKGDGVEDGI